MWLSRGSGLVEHWQSSGLNLQYHRRKKEREGKREGRREEAERDLCVHVVVLKCNGNTQALSKEAKERAGTLHDCQST